MKAELQSGGGVAADLAAARSGPTDADEGPVTVIEPRRGFGLADLAELWRYRELLFFLTWRDVKVRYKQTLLGVSWAVVQPLATMLVFFIFLGRMGGVGAKVEHYALFIFAGMVPWAFFSSAISGAGNSLVANERLVTKVYFPRLAIPLSNVGAALFDLGIAFAVLLVFAAVRGRHPGLSVVLLPVILLLLVAAAAGVGILLSALIVAQRDFRYVLTFGVQLWMFATPSIYLPLTDIGPTTQALLPLNPAHGLILNFRLAVFGGEPDFYALAVSGGVALVLLLIGVVYFRWVEQSFADII